MQNLIRPFVGGCLLHVVFISYQRYIPWDLPRSSLPPSLPNVIKWILSPFVYTFLSMPFIFEKLKTELSFHSCMCTCTMHFAIVWALSSSALATEGTSEVSWGGRGEFELRETYYCEKKLQIFSGNLLRVGIWRLLHHQWQWENHQDAGATKKKLCKYACGIVTYMYIYFELGFIMLCSGK